MAGAAAVASVAIGTMLAMFFVPGDLASEDTLRKSAVALSLGLLAVPFLRLFESVNVAARVENILCFGLVYWLLLELVQGLYLFDVTASTARLAFLAIGLTAVGIWIGASFPGWRVPAIIMRELQTRWEANSIFLAAVACFVLGMLAFAIPSEFDVELMFSSLGEGRFAAPWTRGQLGGLDAFWDHLAYFGYVLPTLYVLYGRTHRWLTLRALLILAMAIVMVAFLAQGGGRRVVGVAVGAALLCWGVGFGRVRISSVLGVMVGSVALLLLLEFMLDFRSAGWGEYESVEASFENVRIDNNFLRLAQAIELFPDVHHFVPWQHLIYLVVRPIPRLFWPGKPTSPGFDLSDMIGDVDVSLAMTMVGECYTMLGFPAVLFGGFIFGRLAAWVNRMLECRQPGVTSVVVPVCIMVLFVGVRGLQDLIIMSYAVLGWLLVSAVLFKMHARRAPRQFRD